MAGTDTLVLRHAAAEPAPAQAGRLQLETNLRSALLSANGAATLGPEGRRHDLEVGVYYVSRDSTGRRDWPSLRRKRLVGGTRPAFQDEELVERHRRPAGPGRDLTTRRMRTAPWTAGFARAKPMNGATPRALRIELEAVSDVSERDQPGLARRKRVSRVVELRNSGAPS